MFWFISAILKNRFPSNTSNFLTEEPLLIMNSKKVDSQSLKKYLTIVSHIPNT